ncbi:MAG: phage virion morphogenesis protein [Burkholderiales bacterium 66-5]|uniref:phage virion morphogenesis protein n=1 Tax=Comamonas badia TaxID=265291 RepID=UPI00040CAAF1|nr:phage virion morphogenesis protein [Comamonas badia]OJU91376.1 MAG: phage virion morphogenesis protein [Burkholderiales bacterium 66-5]
MAGTHLTITTSELDRLQASVRILADGVRDTSTLMPQLGEYLQRSTQERFDTKTAPHGKAWTDLKHPSLKKHNQNKVLTLHGFLRRGIHSQVTAPGTVEVGSNLVYAATHQYGRGGIPARPFLGLSTTDRQEITAIVTDWATELGFRRK